MLTNSALQQAWLLEQEWGEVLEGIEMLAKEANGIQQIAGSSYDVRKYVNAETTRHLRRWEGRSRPLVVDDPPRLLDTDVQAKLGKDFFLMR